MNRPRVIAVFTGNRAEYGLQFPILKAIEAHADLDLRLLVSGAHLDPDFGQTLREINEDGFEVAAEVKIDLKDDTLAATASGIGDCIRSMCAALDRVRPDILVVYADRFEGFAAVIASTQTNLPTAHIEGGDLTEGGALDDSVRHAMTKLAHIHFTTNSQSSNRIMAMGEESWRVHTVGFPAIDLIQEGEFAAPTELAASLGIDPEKPLIVFTQHPVTTQFERAAAQIRLSLEAIGRLTGEGVQVIATYPNNDAGGRRIIDELIEFADRQTVNFMLRPSLGRHTYHGLLALARDHQVACVGNSSSGIKETPAFGCPTVNIGTRQQGRLRGDNVLDVDYHADGIYDAVRRCLGDDKFRTRCRATDNPYGNGGAGVKIADILARAVLDERLLRKRMTLKGLAKDGWFQ